MLTESMAQKLNHQMNLELQSAYSYLGLAGYVAGRSLTGFSHWLTLQAQEELGHAMKIYQYIIDQGAPVRFESVPEPRSNLTSMVEVFEVALSQEQRLSYAINELVAHAVEARDYTTHTFLQWFLTEQVEEVAACSEILQQLTLIGGDGTGLLMLDKELGARQSEGASKNE